MDYPFRQVKLWRTLMTTMRAMSLAGFLVLPAGALFLSTAASAHHSFAMFDNTKTVTVAGTVKDVAYANPHVWVNLVVMNDKNLPATWGMEGGNLGGLYRMGWHKDSVKTGDKIRMDIHPMKDGSPGGQILRVTMEDGRVFGRGGGAPQ
jgi:uncharacterized protein DUF6152